MIGCVANVSSIAATSAVGRWASHTRQFAFCSHYVYTWFGRATDICARRVACFLLKSSISIAETFRMDLDAFFCSIGMAWHCVDIYMLARHWALPAPYYLIILLPMSKQLDEPDCEFCGVERENEPASLLRALYAVLQFVQTLACAFPLRNLLFGSCEIM